MTSIWDYPSKKRIVIVMIDLEIKYPIFFLEGDIGGYRALDMILVALSSATFSQ